VTVELSLQQIARVLNGKIRNGQVLAPGPGHSAADRSLSVKISDSGNDFIVNSFSGDDPLECKKYVREKCGLPSKPNGNRHSDRDMTLLIQEAIASQQKEPRSKPVATYNYEDRDGALLYQVLRYEPKTFRQRRPDANGGWIWKLEDRRVVYRWLKLLQYPSATILVCEGEKDADNVAALDLCATTVAGGKWTGDCVQALAGRHCWIIRDEDEAGRKKAADLAALLHPVAASVKLVQLPGLTAVKDNKDVSDWLAAGHTKDELYDVCSSTPDWTPDDATTAPEPTAAAINLPSQTINLVSAPKAKAPLVFVKIEDWLDRDPPAREWAVLDRFPLRNVSLLSGEGSIGQTILMQQLAAAHVFGRSWLDTLPEIGDAIYLNAEDEEAELHRRFVDIAKFYDSPLGDLKGHLHVLALAGQDAVLGHANNGGLVKPTPLFHQLTEAAGDIKPKLIGLDTSADIFAGAENDRSQVRQFIGLLRQMSIVGNSAVIVCAHPSLTGINTGTGLSGSTAWHNSVRARAYLHTLVVEGTEPDKTLRQLEFMKSNYSAIANSITVRWKDGVFVMEAKPGSLEKIAADAKADEAFMTLLARFTREGRNVSPNPSSPTFAPTTFAKEGTGFNKLHLGDAMRRLFKAEKIKAETYGKSSRPYQRIVQC
jgi:RecA-family ATPase